jgi:hypothetical protein
MALQIVPFLARAGVQAAKSLPKVLRVAAKHGPKPKGKRQEQDGRKRGKGKWVLIAAVLLLSPLILLGVMMYAAMSGVTAAAAGAMGEAAQNAAALCGGPGLHEAAMGGSDGQPQTGELSLAQIAQYAAAAGFTGEDLVIAVAVARAESGGRTDIDNEGLNADGSIDYGLWQINSVHQANGFDPSRAFDPTYNAQWARIVFMNAGASWTPWTTYTNGAYREHLDAAREATGIPAPQAGDPAAQPTMAPITCAPPPMIAGGFPARIDPYQPSDPQVTCDPTPKPGVEDFATMLIETYPATGSSGITRSCDVGGGSEHKEGRAFDWTASVSDPTQRAAVESAIRWLLATDEHGNEHAMFRRFGLMYIIWNRQIFASYRHDEGWRPYSCNPGASFDDCHVGHAHFSFSWDGAMRRTSWWTAQRQGPSAASGRAAPDERL